MEAANFFDDPIGAGIIADFAKDFVVSSADAVVFAAAWAEGDDFTADMADEGAEEEEIFDDLGSKVKVDGRQCLEAQCKKDDRVRKVSRRNMSRW